MYDKPLDKAGYFLIKRALFCLVLFFFSVSTAAAVAPGYHRIDPVSERMTSPKSVSVDLYENRYVTDFISNRLLVYKRNGDHVRTLHGLDGPISSGLDKKSRILIGNRGRGNVEIYNTSDLSPAGKLGIGDGEFIMPISIDVDRFGIIYVCDAKENRIKMYDPETLQATGVTIDGPFDLPTSIAINRRTDEIVVTDQPHRGTFFGKRRARVQVFDLGGTLLRGFEISGINDGKLFRPTGVEVDEEGNIYVADSYQNLVNVYDGAFNFLVSVFDMQEPMRNPGDMMLSATSKLHIASLSSETVEVYQITASSADIAAVPVTHDFGDVGVGSQVEFDIELSNTGSAGLTIHTIGSPASPFSIVPGTGNDCSAGTTLATSETCLIRAQFDPATENIFGSSFEITSNDPDESPLEVTLKGRGVIINEPPVADPNGPYTGTEGQPVVLDGSGSSDIDGSIVRYEWDVDNNGIYDYSSTGSAQIHTYITQGSYTVRLRVTDDFGETDTATTTAEIADSFPTADFTGFPIDGKAPLEVDFTNTSTGYDQPLSYAWDFENDGVTDSTVENPIHVFDTLGTYSVRLTVTDLDGSTDTLIRTGYITVRPLLTIIRNGSGTVTSSPAGIVCGSDCEELYNLNTSVVLQAVPSPGWSFLGWDGSCTGLGTCSVIMDADKTVEAAFSEILFSDDFNWSEESGRWDYEMIKQTGEIVYTAKNETQAEKDLPSVFKTALSLREGISSADVNTIEVKAMAREDSELDRFFIVFAYDAAGGNVYLAGAGDNATEWLIGRMDTGTGAVTPFSSTGGTIEKEKWYDLKVTLSGSSVALFADNVQKAAYTFPIGIPAGPVGIGGQTHIRFDDFRVLADIQNADIFDDFNWHEKSGEWDIETVEGGSIVYRLISNGNEKKHIQTLSLREIATSGISAIEAMINIRDTSGVQNGYIIFGYDESAGRYYRAGADAGADTWKIEEVSIATGTVNTLSSDGDTIEINTWYSLKLILEGGSATLYVNEEEKTGYTFIGGLPEGMIGLGGSNNSAYFDDFKAVD
jgi:PKD repeat protein